MYPQNQKPKSEVEVWADLFASGFALMGWCLAFIGVPLVIIFILIALVHFLWRLT